MPTPYRREDELEALARDARTKLGVDSQPWLEMMTLIVKMKRLGWIKGYLRVADTELPGGDAQYDPDSQILSLRESTFCGANGNEPRERMTFFHELAHIYLGHEQTRHRSVSSRASERVVPAVRRDELQARRFAAAFLAPAHLADHTMTTSQLADRFGMSLQAAAIRKQELEKIYRRANEIQRPLPKAVIEFLKTPKKYESKPCTNCGRRTVVRYDTQLKCDTCGNTEGCS